MVDMIKQLPTVDTSFGASSYNYSAYKDPVANPGSTNTGKTTISSPPANKYRTGNLIYPLDLLSHSGDYGYSNVTFYISVATDSRALMSNQWSAGVGPVNQDMRSDLLGQNITVPQAMVSGAALLGVVGALAGGIGGAVGGAAVGGLGVGGLAYLRSTGSETEGTATLFSRPMKRLKQAITLYVPNNLQVSYTTDWNEIKTSTLSAISMIAGEGGKITDAITNGTMPTGDALLESLGDATGTTFEYLMSEVLGTQVGSQFGVALGMAPNPKLERMFNRVAFRQFEFNYDFAPRSPEEAQAVRSIIYAFKYHMHPEFKSQDKFIYIYPSEFDIEYKFKGRDNYNLFKHTTSVLTNVSVNYTPVNNFNLLADGMPPNINMRLQFTELMVLTKETIEKNA